MKCIYCFKLVFLFFLEKCSEVELIYHIILFLNVWGNFMLFFIVTVLITFPYTVHKSWFLSTFFRTLVFFSCWFSHIDNSYSDRYEWSGILLWFWFVFPWWIVVLNILSCACWPSHIFLGKMSIQFPTFYLDCLFFFPFLLN